MFAWAQTRLNLPGWYGLGSGLAAVRRPRRPAPRRGEAYQGWPLLTVLFDNAEMSLAKTDRRIAARHLALGGRDDLTELVLAEYDLTRRLVLAVTGHDRLLADRPGAVAGGRAARPVRGRAVPSAAAGADRAAVAAAAGTADEARQAEREQLQRLLLLSVNGVAAGLQNTG